MSRILLSKADITELEAASVAAAAKSGWVAPLGPSVDAFEKALCERVGVAHGLALSSGTAALHLALLGVGAGPGTTVVVPSMTFAASANAVAYTGAEPVFVDCLLDDGNIDPQLLGLALDDLIGEGEHVAAFVAVDLLGRTADYGRIGPLLQERGIILIEDAAEALGADFEGTSAGAFGVAGALSFNGNKIMTTSGGGMLLSDDAEFIARARYLSTQARQPVAWYEHTDIGFNYRLSNILAALGLAQLSRLDEMIGRRRAIRGRYAEAFAGIDGVRLLRGTPDRDDSADNCWLTSLIIDPQRSRIDARGLISAFDAADIEARHVWKPMHLQPVFAANRAWVNGNSEYLFINGVTLPSGSALLSDDIDRVIEVGRAALGA
ncbi:MAG TPA: aminotransferase class I/II-fold pyridoxal phosphate-dependent enzyme [Dermatophilaceae bacterium]|nr:aminotransferase class I/II-fold pyridoxal phosphate-dependent enzyme [Dermatophilaceae bacterium]